MSRLRWLRATTLGGSPCRPRGRRSGRPSAPAPGRTSIAPPPTTPRSLPAGPRVWTVLQRSSPAGIMSPSIHVRISSTREEAGPRCASAGGGRLCSGGRPPKPRRGCRASRSRVGLLLRNSSTRRSCSARACSRFSRICSPPASDSTNSSRPAAGSACSPPNSPSSASRPRSSHDSLVLCGCICLYTRARAALKAASRQSSFSVELLVESGARNPRPRAHFGDADALVADPRAEIDHRAHEALTLGRLGPYRRHAVARLGGAASAGRSPWVGRQGTGTGVARRIPQAPQARPLCFRPGLVKLGFCIPLVLPHRFLPRRRSNNAKPQAQ